MPSAPLDPEFDPASWSRQMLVARPDAIVAAVDRFQAGIVAAVAGDIDSARTAFSPPDADSLRAWVSNCALTAGARRSSIRQGVRRFPLPRRMPRPTARDGARDREILERDHYRCRYCAAPLMHADHLRRLRRIVGDDVLSAADDDSFRLQGQTTLPHPIWLLTCGTTHAPIRSRPRRRPLTGDLVAACLPCQRGAAGFSLDELGLDDPHDRPPGALPDWYPLLDLLDNPPSGAYALVRHFLLLDGSTLNLAGQLVCSDTSHRPLRVSVSCNGRTLATTVATVAEDGLAFHGHLVLAGVFRSGPAPEHLEVELQIGDDPLRFVALPGAMDTPNRAVIEPIAEIAGLGRRIIVGTDRGISLQLDRIPTRADVIAVEASTHTISLVISPSTAPSADAVWIQRRGARADTGRIDLEHIGQGSWILVPDVRLVPGGPDEVVLWDAWVSWSTSDGQVTERAGRLSSDLLAVRDAVRLPSVSCEVEDCRLRIRPYFTLTRHLAMRVSSVPAEAEPK